MSIEGQERPPRCGAFFIAVWCLLFISTVGCGTTARVVITTTDRQGQPRVYTPKSDQSPVEVGESGFKKAFALAAREVNPVANTLQYARLMMSGLPWQEEVSLTWDGRRLLSSTEVSEKSRQALQGLYKITRAYAEWCESEQRPRDCLDLLQGKSVLGPDGRYALAMEFALRSVWSECADVFRGLANPGVVRSMVVSAMAMYMMLWVLPEPISKGIAAALTASLIVYLGVDTVWALVGGWRQLVEEADHATTFGEIRTSGARFGKIMGQNGARVFIILATTALGQTVGSVTKGTLTTGRFPFLGRTGAGESTLLSASSDVTSVSVSAEGLFTIALTPHAVAMAARPPEGSSSPVPEHHIATNKWNDATHSGGPWTPKFQEIFDRAEMSLDDPANRVRLPAHQGPHPQAYHEEIFERLDRATSMCRTPQQCRLALTDSLKRLAQEILTPGSRLNTFLTRGN